MATKRKQWTKERLLNLIFNAHFDLFNDNLNRPKKYEIKKWLDDYLKRETFKTDKDE